MENRPTNLDPDLQRGWALAICDELGIRDLESLDDMSIDEIVDLVAQTNYGEGENATDQELSELREALVVLRAGVTDA